MVANKIDERRHLIKYLRTQSNEFIHLMPKLSSGKKGQPIHRLRVATRRARAVLSIVKNDHKYIELTNLNRELRQLSAKKRNAERKLDELVSLKPLNRIIQRLSIAEENIRATRPSVTHKVQAKLVKLLNQENTQKKGNIIDFHKLRINLKKVRYVLEALGRPIEPLEKIQKSLRDAHDLELLQTLTRKNQKLKLEQQSPNQQSIRILKPVLRFAINQLKIN